MRNINFIESTSPEQHHSLRQWYQITAAALLLLFLSISAFSGWQLYQLYSTRTQARMLQQRAAPFFPVFERKGKLEQEVTLMSKKTDQIKRLASRTKQQLSYLNAIHNTCAHSLSVKSVRLEESPEEIILSVPTITSATTCIEQLRKECGIDNLTIASLEPAVQQKSGFLISIQRTRKSKEIP